MTSRLLYIRQSSAFCTTAALVLLMVVGCGSAQKKDRGFFTSGSKEADQRADQRMAKTEQLKGGTEGRGDKKSTDEDRRTLFERLGGMEGINAVVEDSVPRLLADPRVNFGRKGITRGGFTIHRSQSVEWKASPEKIQALKLHIAQFLALATGGPAKYDGKEMKASHAGLHITNAEFDAAVGDLKATLDKLKIANKEQKELLSIVESTRTQIAEER